MRNLPCVLWLMGFPVADALTCWVQVQAGVHRPHEPLNPGVALTMLLIWAGVGALLYRRSA